MATRKKLPATLAVAALTATLYGCGGGGDNRFVDLEDQLGTALTAESLKKLQDEKKAAEDERDKAKEKARMDLAAAEEKRKADLAAAETTAEEKRKADLAAAEVKRKADLAAAEVKRKADLATAGTTAEEKRKADLAAAEVKRKADLATAEVKRKADLATAEVKRKADLAAAETTAEEKRKADLAAAETTAEEKRRKNIRIARVKEVERAVNADADLPFTTPGGVQASRDSDGMVTIELSAESAEDADDLFTGGSGSAAADGRWTRVSMTENEPDKSDTIIVYTDVEAPTPFTSRKLLEEEGSTSDDEEMFVVITGPVPVPDDASVPRQENAARLAARVKYMVVDNNIPIGGSLSISPSNPTFDGSYRDIDGTFTCVSDGCTITAKADDDGGRELELDPVDRIRFVPDPTSEGSDIADMKYTYFGWWSEETDWWPEEEDDLQEQIINLSPFSGGSHPANITPAMTGTAKYTGKASGIYAIPTYEGDVPTDGEIGTFEADVTLNASFRTDGHTIFGKVVDFMTKDTDDTMMHREKWSVELSAALIPEGDGTEPHVSGGVSVRFDDRRDDAMRGDWEATFYNSDDDSSSDHHPDTITGTFDASAPEGILTGGFGAKIPEPEMDMPPAEQ